MIISPPGVEGLLAKLDSSSHTELDVALLHDLAKDYGVELLSE